MEFTSSYDEMARPRWSRRRSVRDDVADPVGVRRLVAAAVGRPLRLQDLPVETSIASTPACDERPRDLDGVVGVIPPSAQSVAEMRTDIGRSSGHAARMARTPRRVAQPVLERSRRRRRCAGSTAAR
jgi:hypothetical protein